MTSTHFGWTIPRWPQDGSSARHFVGQIVQNLEHIATTFDSAWVSDHVLAAPNQPDLPAIEGWTTMSYLAHAFPTLQFGTVVLAQAFRNPALLAKMGATLQLLSGGRLILGIGAGWWEDEARAYGYDFAPAPARIQQLEEVVQIIRQLWTATPATFHGTYYQITQAVCEPKPQPQPPIMIGGCGEQRTLRAVARFADWWHCDTLRIEQYVHKLDILRSHCRAVGRASSEIVQVSGGWVAIGATDAEAQRIVETSSFGAFISIVGSAEQVVEQLRAYTALGVTHFILGFADFPDPRGAMLFAEEVIPRLRRGGGNA